MAISKLNFNSLNITAAANKGIGFDSGADDLEATFSGGDMTFIKKLTASSSGTLSFVNGASSVVLDSTYKKYMFIFKDIHPGTDDVQFQINFRETNTSFTDIIMRPWLIMAAHHGYVARNKSLTTEAEKDMKCNITILQYTRSDKGLSQIPRKTWRFFNCIPTSLDTRQHTYTDDEAIQNYNVSFAYDKYEISNNLYLTVDQFIKNLNPFGF